jgi:hypothetical protein
MEMDEYERILGEIERNGNQIFSVTFARRNDKVEDGKIVARAGDRRTMRCRLHVKKDVQGVQHDRKGRDRSNRIVTVYEMAGERSGFKCIPVDGIIEVSGVEV